MDDLPAITLDLSQSVALGDGGETHGLGATAGAVGERSRLGFLRRNLFWCGVAIVVAGIIGGLAYLQTWPPMAIVQSGSMVPTIQIGDVVVLKHLDGPPKVGEIVVIHVPDAARARYGYPPVVTHRIVAIARNGDITTKGDALKTDDPFTTLRGTVTEKVAAIIPDAGRVYGFFTSSWGILWLLVGAVLLFGAPLLDGWRERDRQEREAALSLQAQFMTLTKELAGRQGEPAAATAPGALETKLAAVVEQVATTQQTLAGTIAALKEHQDRIQGAHLEATTVEVISAEPHVPEVRADLEADPDAWTEPEPEPEAWADFEPEAWAWAWIDLEPEARAEADPEPEVWVWTWVDPEPEAWACAWVDPEPEAWACAWVDPEPEAWVDPEPEAEADTNAEINTSLDEPAPPKLALLGLRLPDAASEPSWEAAAAVPKAEAFPPPRLRLLGLRLRLIRSIFGPASALSPADSDAPPSAPPADVNLAPTPTGDDQRNSSDDASSASHAGPADPPPTSIPWSSSSPWSSPSSSLRSCWTHSPAEPPSRWPWPQEWSLQSPDSPPSTTIDRQAQGDGTVWMNSTTSLRSVVAPATSEVLRHMLIRLQY